MPTSTRRWQACPSRRPPDFSGAASLTLFTDDLGNNSSETSRTAEDTVAISVSDAPVNTVPDGQTTQENTALTFSAANGNAIAIADADAGSSAVEVTLTAADGTLSLSGTSGLTFTVGDGTNDALLTFSGTLADINAALDGLTFTPDTDFVGPASVHISTSHDSETDEDEIAISVISNDPVNFVPYDQQTLEDTALVFSAAGGNSIAISAPAVEPGDVEVTLTATNGTLTLSGTSGLTFSTGDGAEDAAVTFTGTVTNINAALEGLTFFPDANYAGAALLTILLDDLGSLTDEDEVAITVRAGHDAPMGTDNTVETEEDSDYVFAAGDFGFSDATDDPAHLLQAVVITSLPTYGSLSNNGVALTAGDYVYRSDIDAGNLVFAPAQDGNGIGYAAFTFQVQDDGTTHDGGLDVDGTARTMTIDLTAVNDVPGFIPGENVSVVEDSGPYYAAWANSISSGPPDESGQTLTFNVSNDNNSLFEVQPGIDASGNLTFTPAANAIGSATITVSLQDDGGTDNGGVDTSTAVTFTITVTQDTAVGIYVSQHASEDGTVGQFVVFRSSDFDVALTVNYTVSGTATSGVDYTLPASITIPVGESYVLLPVTAIMMRTWRTPRPSK